MWLLYRKSGKYEIGEVPTGETPRAHAKRLDAAFVSEHPNKQTAEEALAKLTAGRGGAAAG